MERNSRAALSPYELMSLRLLRGDPRHTVPSRCRRVLLSMGLIAVCGDELKLTGAGHSRLARDETQNARPRGRREGPLFYLG